MKGKEIPTPDLGPNLQLKKCFFRSGDSDADVSVLMAGVHLCKLCSYKTNLKANFQLHLKGSRQLIKINWFMFFDKWGGGAFKTVGTFLSNIFWSFLHFFVARGWKGIKLDLKISVNFFLQLTSCRRTSTWRASPSLTTSGRAAQATSGSSSSSSAQTPFRDIQNFWDTSSFELFLIWDLSLQLYSESIYILRLIWDYLYSDSNSTLRLSLFW